MDDATPLEIYEQFAADVDLMVSNYITGRMDADDVIAELRDKGIELRAMLKR